MNATFLSVVRRGLYLGTCARGPLAFATVPMSSPNIRQSFQKNPQCADVGTALKNTTIKVIHLNHEENDTWSKTSFWQECLAEGIQISSVEPCRLQSQINQRSHHCRTRSLTCFHATLLAKGSERTRCGSDLCEPRKSIA